MGPTEGIQRGFRVRRTGAPISVPIGENTLGRIFDVLGRTIDDGPRLDGADVVRSPIHKEPPSLAAQKTRPEMLETGHQGHRPDSPVHEGREDRDFRRCRSRQDRHREGAHPQHCHRAPRVLGVRRSGGEIPRGNRPVAGDGGVEGPGQDRARLRPDERASRATGCAWG